MLTKRHEEGKVKRMNEPIRVLQVVTAMNRGGLENMIMNYYRNIDRNKVQFDFLTHRAEDQDFDDEIKKLGGKIYHISRLNPFSYRYLRELNHFFQTHTEYRIIHVHQDCLSGVALKIAKKNGVPVRIAHCHSSSQDKGVKYYIKLIYKKNIKKYATKLFACGDKAGKWMFETDYFETLPNAIDAKKYVFDVSKRIAMRKELNLGESYVIGHVGRFSKVKNHEFLLDVFENIYRINQNTKLLLVGTGEKKKDIEKIVREKQLENCVIFTGLRIDINMIMQAMDIFVLPSLYEGVPVTMVEAQAAGLPCIISDRVPLDCKITENVRQLPLDSPISEWTDSILKYQNFKRENMYEAIVKKNYDIKNNARYLQNYYIEQYKMG